MRRMQLDFVAPGRPAGPAGWLLLFVGIVCLAAVAARDRLHWQPLNAAAARDLHSLHAAIEARRPPLPKLDDAQLVAEWTRAIAVTDELNLPWESLFATFEAEKERRVALLSLEPDAGKRRLVVVAEAGSFDDMLGYYRVLQQQRVFSGLALHTHQVNRQDREKPIRFRITARWMADS